MSVKIDGGMMGPNLRMSTQMTTARQTPNTSFGARVQSGLNNAAGVVSAGVGAAAGFLPGGGIVTAAISSAQTLGNSAGSGMGGPYAGAMSAGAGAVPSTSIPGTGTGGGTVVGGGSVGGSSGTLLGNGAAGASVADQVNGNFSLNQMMADNTKLLNMQASIQHESQLFTAVSNVMKSRHDTIKNSISNVR